MLLCIIQNYDMSFEELLNKETSELDYYNEEEKLYKFKII